MKNLLLLFTATLFLTSLSFSQDLQPTATETLVKILLKNNKGGFYKGVEVSFTNDSDGKVFKATSGYDGWVNILLPHKGTFEVKMSNYFRPWKLPLSGRTYSIYETEYKYTARTQSMADKYPMSTTEKAALLKMVMALPDTTFYKASGNRSRKADMNYSLLKFTLTDLKDGPLRNEKLFFDGRKSGKVFTGETDNAGKLNVLLPKGDVYDLNFTYDKKYEMITLKASKVINNQRFEYSYLGTEEIEKRKEAERKRLEAYEKQLKEEAEAMEKYLKKLGLTYEEYLAKQADKEALRSAERQNLLDLVFKRNLQWKDKLIVCDLTGSMSPYAAQLVCWYKLNYLNDQKMKFCFFNDGDNKRDSEKVIGSTGGIYHCASEGYDQLVKMVALVQRAGGGGDGPENNMEALIKGVKEAPECKDIIMVVDNYAPVKDISLLSQFKRPVHIILCGASDGFIHEDYMNIAFRTDGTVHTIEEDITALSELAEGGTIAVQGVLFKLMNKKLVKIDKL